MHSVVEKARGFEDDEIQRLWDIVQAAQDRAAGDPAQRKPDKFLFTIYDDYFETRPELEETRLKYYDWLVLFSATPLRDEQNICDRFVRVFELAGVNISYDRPPRVTADVYEDDEYAITSSDDEVEEEAENKVADQRVNAMDPVTNRPPRREANTPLHPVKANNLAPRSVSQPMPVQERRRSVSRDGLGRMRMEDLPHRGRRASRAVSVDLTGTRPRSMSVTSNNDITRRADSMDRGSKRLGRSSGLHGEELRRAFREEVARELSLLPETIIEVEREDFAHKRELKVARSMFRMWRAKTRDNRALEAQAVAHDNARLLRKAFGSSHRSAIPNKHETSEEERLFEERRKLFAPREEAASRAYDHRCEQLALTHWVREASQRQADTKLARKYMTLYRHFMAWDHLVALDKLQTERFQKRVFLKRWWKKFIFQRQRENYWAPTYEEKVLRSCIIKWRRLTWANGSLRTTDSRAVRRCLHQWYQRASELWAMYEHHENERDTRLARRALMTWRQKAAHRMRTNLQADQWRKKRLANLVFADWQRQSIVVKHAKELEVSRQTKVKRKYLAIWAKRAVDNRKARIYRNERLARDLLTHLQFTHRLRYLQGSINDRLIGEMMYKWYLATQESRSARGYESNLKRNAFNVWANQVFEKRAMFEETTAVFAVTQQRIDLTRTVRKWVQAMIASEEREKQAQAFRSAKLVKGALKQWRSKHEHAMHLQKQCEAARFYVLASKVVKVWQEATSEHQRIRRREAYATIRRQHKITQARTMLHRLRDAVAHRRALEQVAAERAEDRLAGVAVSCFNHWLVTTRTHVEQSTQASQYYNQRLIVSGFQKLQARSAEITQLSTIAAEFHLAGTERSASACFRRLDRRFFQIRGQDQWAVTLRQRLFEKHVRIMLRYWNERVTIMRENRRERRGIVGGEDSGDAEDELSPEDADGRHDPDSDTYVAAGSTTVKANTSSIDAFASRGTTIVTTAGSIATPLPGYLRTPSKRGTALARAREQLLAFGLNEGTAQQPAEKLTSRHHGGTLVGRTPATAPAATQSSRGNAAGDQDFAITPFERKLRAQGYATGGRRLPAGRGLAAATPGTPAPVSTPITITRRPPGLASRSRLAFGGFEDITEDGGGN